jgi:hypothetical protein
LRAKQTGKSLPPAIAPNDHTEGVPEFPYPLQYLWDYFLEICCGVPHDDYGQPQILWSELRAWSELMHIDLEPWETSALTLIGRKSQNVAAEAFNTHMKQKSHG